MTGPKAKDNGGKPGHVPVLAGPMIEFLAPRDGGIYVDGTFGGGGYTRAILDAADCRVCAIDRDPDAIERARALSDTYGERLTVILGRFGEIDRLLAAHGISTIDGLTLDVGVSSMQIDTAERGFSFRQDGPLDMRMAKDGQTAAELINTAAESDIADILYIYGEERASRRIARAIVNARAETPLTRTSQLADIVRDAAPGSRRPDAIDPATRTFQAIRIYLNDEIGELRRGLAAAEKLIGPGGRLVIVSFHSLEDREVKTFLNHRAGRIPNVSRHEPAQAAPLPPSFELLTRRPVRPDEAELAANPRARSARLRAAQRTDAAPQSAAPQSTEGRP